MSDKQGTSKITGKISASPTLLSFGQRSAVISWETNDPAGAEVRVSSSGGDEKVVSKARCGQKEIPWITGSIAYDFRLYGTSQPSAPLDCVRVQRDRGSTREILRELADAVTHGNVGIPELSEFISTSMPYCLHGGKFHEIFPLWEEHGFHVTPVHFYQPIPEVRSLPEALWTRRSDLVGIDMNDSVQLELLRRDFPKFRKEYEQFPTAPTGEPGRFYLNNDVFDGADALIAYCMVRHFQPRLIVEVGSGFSSLVLGEAVQRNKGSSLICIEPFPQEFLKRGFPGLYSLIEKKVEDFDVNFFSQLGAGDILFIDSSHTVKIGGDVNYLFLEIMPRLKPGVIVHVHDIALPLEYPREWVAGEFRFWAEQYLLQAFLAFNSEFEVLLATNYIRLHHLEDLKASFPTLPSLRMGSFWMRRKLTSVSNLKS